MRRPRDRTPERNRVLTAVADLLAGYVERGVFHSLSGGQRRGSRTTFAIGWHYGRQFRLVLDSAARAVVFPELLPSIPTRSAMATELRAFLRQFESEDLPAHRRIDPAKARLTVRMGRRGVSVALAVRAGEWEYCARKLVHIAQEVYLVFLPDGPYDDYRIQKLGLDPDGVWT